MSQSEHVPEDYAATLFSDNPERPYQSQDRQNEDEERGDQELFQDDSLHVGGSSASIAFLQEILSLPQHDANWSAPTGVISGLNSPGASDSLNSVNGSFKNGEDVKQEIQLIDLGPNIPEVLFLETITKEKCDDQMERAATGRSLSDKLSYDSSGGDEVGEKKVTPLPGRPLVLRLGERCVTPQKTRKSSLSPPTDPPGSPTSLRTNTSRSEIYHYTYETTSRSPPSPVPPFVVVHNSGVAHVTIRPTKRVVWGPSTVNEEEEEEIVVPSRSSWRPAFLFVLAALLFLAVITMVSGLVRQQELKRSGVSSSNSLPPSRYPKTQSPTVSPLSGPTPKPVFEVPNENDDAIILIPPLEDGKSPREETESPAYVAPTRPPRTRAPVTTSPTFAQTPGPTELKVLIDDTPSPSETRPTQPPRTQPPVPQPKPTAEPTWQPTHIPSIEPDEEQPSDPSSIEPTNDEGAAQVARAEDYVLGLIALLWPPAFLAISEQNSPQYKAFEWVVSDPMVVNFSYTDTRIIQRWILAVWYYSTLGDNWIRSDNWLTYTNECDWFSTRKGGDHICDGDGNLQIIELERNRLNGSIPRELGLLSNSLKRLFLRDNDIGGTLPIELGSLQQLEFMELTHNSLRGPIPTEFGELSNLIVLGLGKNTLDSVLPSELGKLNRLDTFGIEKNEVNGAIPTEFGDMRHIRFIGMDKNKLSGQVPSELGSLPRLTHLKLAHNPLSGVMPNELCNSTDFILRELSADCDKVVCPCCNKCCKKKGRGGCA